jgi:capsular polysaccharide export protein
MPNIAYLDPPFSRYFHRLAARLSRRLDADVLALLSSPAYRVYAASDRSLVWPGGKVPNPPALPPDSAHAVWSQTDDEEFRAVFWHAVAWFREQFRANNIGLVLIFSDARPFSLAAEVAASELGVRWIYFERGAYRFCTASISTTGLNGRFSLRGVCKDSTILGAGPDDDLHRRPLERGLKRHFARFIFANAWASMRHSELRRLQHKHYALGPYLRLQWMQWWAEWLAPYQDRRLRLSADAPTVVVPLQSPSDSQLQLYSPFDGNQAFLDFVCAEVRRVAPNAQLIVKRHPMDVRRYTMPPGAVRVIGNLARFFVRDPLIVCVNSTVGFEAAARGMQVICFGRSFYAEGDFVTLATPQDFGRHVVERLGHPRDPVAGRSLRDAVLRWYQAPGDAWAFTKDDLDRTVQIIEEHCAAAAVHACRRTETTAA